MQEQTNLATLSLFDGTGVTDPGPRPGMTRLCRPNLDTTPVADLGPLASLPALRSLHPVGAVQADTGLAFANPRLDIRR